VIALVGATGAGKTTLVSLIPRFYDPIDGRVLLDGIDVREFQLRGLRQQVAMVLQQPLVFPTTVRENVAYRLGAIPDQSIVNVTGQHVRKENVFPSPPTGSKVGSDFQTKLGVSAWVRNRAYQKYVWVDLHVFDGHDAVIARQTLPLQWQMPGAGDGESFGLDTTVYRGSTATPGSVSPRPDARKLQYRLYYEVSGRVYTDGVAHEQQLPEDAVVK